MSGSRPLARRATAHEIHFSGDDPSSGDCVTGDCHLSIKRQSGGSSVVKACVTDLWHNDFAVTPSLTATVVGNEVVISVPGIAGKTINWVVISGV